MPTIGEINDLAENNPNIKIRFAGGRPRLGYVFDLQSGELNIAIVVRNNEFKLASIESSNTAINTDDLYKEIRDPNDRDSWFKATFKSIQSLQEGITTLREAAEKQIAEAKKASQSSSETKESKKDAETTVPSVTFAFDETKKQETKSETSTKPEPEPKPEKKNDSTANKPK